MSDDSLQNESAQRDDASETVLAKMKLSSEQGTRALTPAAKRALAEAEERRRKQEAEKVHPDDLPPEVNGRDGPEPIRYGDWEKNGIISDF